MITVVQGRPGMGKTIYLVAEILRKARTHNVYTNVTLSLPDSDKRKSRIHFIEGLDDCLTLREGEIVLDEIQVYLNSRNWDKLDMRFQVLLQQHRKRGLNLLGACQSVSRADVVFRELVGFFFEIRKIAVFPFKRVPFGFFYLREFNPDKIDADSPEPIGWPWILVADPYLLNLYNTYQEIEIKPMAGRRFREEYVISEKKTQIRQLLAKEEVIEAPVLPSEVVLEQPPGIDSPGEAEGDIGAIYHLPLPEPPLAPPMT